MDTILLVDRSNRVAWAFLVSVTSVIVIFTLTVNFISSVLDSHLVRVDKDPSRRAFVCYDTTRITLHDKWADFYLIEPPPVLERDRHRPLQRERASQPNRRQTAFNR